MTLSDSIVSAFEAGELPGLHAVRVVRAGETLAEVCFRGIDENWGQPLGERQHAPDALHDVRSITKSVVGLLYGIAHAEGAVPSLDMPVREQFPEYASLAAEPERRRILVRHLLSMKMGIEWNEDLPYSDPRNSEIAMEHADDRYRYVLEQRIVDEPGDHWVYNGGAVAIVAKLIADGVGMPIDRYAEEKLFAPLGIETFEWVRGADGVPSAASGLRLSLRDLTRIGHLVLDAGQFNGVSVVPSDWLETSFTPRATLAEGPRYGYLWWLAPWGDPPAWVAGFGNGGQRLTIQAEHRLVVAVLAGNYNDPEAWRIPVRVMEEHVMPRLRV